MSKPMETDEPVPTTRITPQRIPRLNPAKPLSHTNTVPATDPRGLIKKLEQPAKPSQPSFDKNEMKTAERRLSIPAGAEKKRRRSSSSLKSSQKRKKRKTSNAGNRRRSSVSKSPARRSESPPPEHKGRTIKIGIILTEPKQERKKEELIPINQLKRPWCKMAVKEHVMRRTHNKGNYIKDPSRKVECVPADVSIGLYIDYTYGGYGVEVDYILPKDLSVERCKQNDINFCLIYDLLEAYHVDSGEGKPIYEEFKRVLKECTVYPPYDYQKFINSKIIYYNWLEEKKINIAPTRTLTPKEFHEKYPEGGAQAAEDLWTSMKADGWFKYVAKPVYGQESKALHIGLTGWKEAQGWMPIHEIKREKKTLAGYLDHVMDNYPGVVFQKFIPDFGNGKKCPELRLYYLGDNYEYSMCSAGNSYLRPTEEGGKTSFPMDVLKPHTKKIFDQLPKLVVGGVEVPRLLTRFDMGYMNEGKMVEPYVNEIEFVPSLYIEDHPFVVEDKLGDRMVEIALKVCGTNMEELASYLDI